MSGKLILLLLASAIVFIVTLAVLLAHTVDKRIKACFAGISVALVYWQVLVYVTSNIHSNLVFWNNLVFWGPSAALVFSFTFTGLMSQALHGRERQNATILHKVVTYFAGVASLIQLVALLSNEIFIKVTFNSQGSSYEYTRGSWYGFYIFGLIALILCVIGRLILIFRLSEKKSQSRDASRTFLVTVAAATSYGIITNVLVPVLTGSDRFIGLGLLSIDIFAGGLALSIIRYRFLDIRFFVVRAAVYLTTLFVTAILFVTPVVLLFGHFLNFHPNVGLLVLIVVLSVAALYAIQYLKDVFDKATNRLFFRYYYDPQSFIEELNQVLVANIELEILLTSAAQVIASNLKTEYCLFGITETKFRKRRIFGTAQKTFSDHDIEAVRHITPFMLENVIVTDNLPPKQEALKRLLIKNDISVLTRIAPPADTHQPALGYVILGEKKNGSPYNTQDVKILNIISKSLLVAVQNALHFEEIEKFNETLQQKVEEATRKLRRTNNKLKRLDETKDEFISLSSHQLRTPLTSVKGYVSMVLDGDAGRITRTQRKLLSQAFISSQRMTYLVSDMLNLSRLRTGKFIIEPVPTNLGQVIKGEISQLLETAESRNLKLVFHQPEHFPTLMLDETKMRQVIMNFIDNAIYYTRNGGRIDVNLVEKPQSIEFTVVDNGIGVPKREQHHLFTKFYRAQNAQRARPDGTGLGLFMARKVIVAQGGAIIFRSQEGKGSTFGFNFAKQALMPKATAPITVTDE